MKNEATEKWAAIDLHVHTPASNDYRGRKDDSEYLALIKRVSEVGGRKSFRTRKSQISCICFTDHNSVEGFRKWRELYENTVSLAEAIRLRDPSNELLKRLDEDLETLQSVRVLMGVEIKSDPGVHLLLVFHESVKPEAVEAFLSEAYNRPYDEFRGSPEPITTWRLEETLDHVARRFGEQVMVVAPHIENDGGIWDALKNLNTLRMNAIKHPSIRALSFGRLETRNKLRELLQQGDYKRTEPVAFIQSSDYHAQPGAQIGQPRTEVLVPNGRATFTAISQAFRYTRCIKCSVDFTQEDYEKLTSGQHVVRFKSEGEGVAFREQDFDAVADAVCAMSNSDSGVVELECNIRPEMDRATYVQDTESALQKILATRLAPAPGVIINLDLRFSPSRLKVLFKPFGDTRLRTSNGHVYIVGEDKVRVALPHEIEAIVARHIEERFGQRFEVTLDEVSNRATRLAKMPAGIALLLQCEQNLEYLNLTRSMIEYVEPISSRGRDVADLARSTQSALHENCAFGTENGNATFIWSPAPPRNEEHYFRFTTYRGEVDPDTVKRISTATVEESTLVVYPGGAVGIVESGSIVSKVTALLLRPKQDEWRSHLFGIAAWLKSSFFLWYCTVHLGDPDIYKYLQRNRARIPIPRFENTELYRRLDSLGRNIVLDEKKFLSEYHKDERRGVAEEHRDKIRKRHNAAMNRVFLTIDKEISDFLNFSDDERKFVARTIRAMDMTDFGFLDIEGSDEKEAGAHA